MGCNNSTALPQPISDIRRTISKIAPEKEVKTQKKIAKNFNNFEDFLQELKLLLKENEFYDFLFRAEYFQEMLDFINSTYTNHQQAMKIVALALEYMALSKNFINGRQTLKTRFKVQALPSQLSKKWTEIRKEVTYVNQNCLRALNYLAYDIQKEKCWFDHSFLELKFDFSAEEARKVADAAKEVCKLDWRGFSYFSNYLLKCCVKQYESAPDMTQIEAKLKNTFEQVLAANQFPLALNGQEVIFDHHKNYKANAVEIPKIELDLSQVQQNLKVQTIENFIFDKAKLAIKSLIKFNSTFQQVCYEHGCSHYRSQVRLKTRSQKKEILKIKQQFVGFAAEKREFEKIWRQAANPSFQNITGLQYQFHRKDVNSYCQSQTGKLKFKVSDMLRSQCTFNDINQLNECCDALLKEIIKKGYKLLELSNKLRAQREIPHIVLKVLVEEIVCEFKLIFQFNFSGFYFSSLLQEMSKLKHFSLVTQLKNFNEDITTNFVKEASQIIQANHKNKFNFGEKLTFSDIRPFFKEFVSSIPFKVDLSKKHQQSIDFNLIFDELQEYKLIQEEFINEQVKVEKNEKIRRIAEYLFYQKKFQLSSMLFTLYQKEIEENNTYLFDKIAKGSKEYIKAEIQLIKSYSDSMHFLAEISKEKQSYEEQIEYLKKFTHFNTLKVESKQEKIKVLRRIAEAYKLDKNYDEAIKIYHQCFQGKDDQLLNGEIHHLLSELYLKVKDNEEALKQEMSNYHILDKKKRNSLQCVSSLKRLAEIYKASNNTTEAFDKIVKAKQIVEVFKSKYTLEYVDLLVQHGNFQHKMNKYNNAVINFQEALEILEKLQGDHYIEVQKLHLKLGNLYQQLENNIEAIKRYKRSQQIVKYIFGAKSLQHSNILNNLGLAYQNIAQYPQSIKFFLQCLEIRKELLGEKNMEYIRTVINIGVVYDEQGMSGQALTKYKQSLALLEKHYGNENADYAKVLNNIGSVEQQQGNYQEALKHFQQALVIKQKLKGVSSKQYATTLSNIGMVHDDMCDYASALKEYQKCVEIFQQMKTKNNALLAATYNNIGTTYMHLGNYQQALKYYGKCLVLEQHLRGVQSREYSLCLHSIGIIKLQQNDYAQVQQLFEKAKKILKKNISSNSYEYSQILISFGKLYLNTRLIDQALVCFQQAQQILQRSKGSSHISEINILLQKGIANIRLHHSDKALQLLQKGLHLCEENNYKYREYASLNYNIGIVYMGLEKYMTSKRYLMKALMLQQRFFDSSWKMTSVKLAVILQITLQEKLFEVYSAYSRPDEDPKRPGNKQNQH